MLQHHQETQVDSHLNPPVRQDQFSHPRVEVYLDSLCAPVASLDESHHSENRTEMRVHIESLIEANLELGDSLDVAVEHALAQFGKSRTIQREWKRTCSEPPTFKQALLTALRLNAAAGFAAGIARPVSLRYGSGSEIGWQLMVTVLTLTVYVLPMLTGLTIGLFAKRRPMLATLYSLLLLLLPMTVLNANLSQLIVRYIYPNGATREWAGVFLLFWIPFGCAGAGVGSLIRWTIQRTSRKAIAR